MTYNVRPIHYNYFYETKRSNDRKVANAVTKNGKQSAIANTFGLPAGKAYSCPGATMVCESICYAGKLEKIFPGVKKNLLHNWELLRNADMDTMLILLDEMIVEFINDCEKKKPLNYSAYIGTATSLMIPMHMLGK